MIDNILEFIQFIPRLSFTAEMTLYAVMGFIVIVFAGIIIFRTRQQYNMEWRGRIIEKRIRKARERNGFLEPKRTQSQIEKLSTYTIKILDDTGKTFWWVVEKDFYESVSEEQNLHKPSGTRTPLIL